MFKIIFRLALVIFIHIVLFAAYPETGKSGNLFLGISLFCWCALVFMTSTMLRKISIGFISLMTMLVFYGVEIATVSYLMPQTDKVTVFDKMLKGRFPTVTDFKSGLRTRFGLDIDAMLNKAGTSIKDKTNEFEKEHGKEIKDAAEEVKEGVKEETGEIIKEAGETMQQVGETVTE